MSRRELGAWLGVIGFIAGTIGFVVFVWPEFRRMVLR